MRSTSNPQTLNPHAYPLNILDHSRDPPHCIIANLNTHDPSLCRARGRPGGVLQVGNKKVEEHHAVTERHPDGYLDEASITTGSLSNYTERAGCTQMRGIVIGQEWRGLSFGPPAESTLAFASAWFGICGLGFRR
jgi:hypothetical protein